jgi:hypothetical protein
MLLIVFMMARCLLLKSSLQILVFPLDNNRLEALWHLGHHENNLLKFVANKKEHSCWHFVFVGK